LLSHRGALRGKRSPNSQSKTFDGGRGRASNLVFFRGALQGSLFSSAQYEENSIHFGRVFRLANGGMLAFCAGSTTRPGNHYDNN
jgi:hypothetical protein